MENAYVFRAKSIAFYKRNETIINAVFKFLFTLAAVALIGAFCNGELETRCLLIAFISGVFAVVLPPYGYMLTLGAVSAAIITMASVETGVMAFLCVFMAFVFVIRLMPKQSLIIPAVIFCFYLKIPYAAALFAGAYMELSALIPLSLGVFLYYIGRELPRLIAVAPAAQFSSSNVIDNLVNIYIEFADILSENTQWIAMACVFALAALSVKAVNKFSADYSGEISYVIGGAVEAFGCAIAYFMGYIEENIILTIVFCVISVIIMEAARFYDIALDYLGGQRVRFEDNNYYYYVKLIPKINPDVEYERKPKAKSKKKRKTKNKAENKNKTDITEDIK